MAGLQTFGADVVTSEQFNATRDKRGLWVGDQTFYIRTAVLLTNLPAIGAVHPVLDWMTLEDLEITGEEGGYTQAVGKYVGSSEVDFGEFDDDQGEEFAEYTLDIVTSEEPLEVHPRYFDVLTVDQIQIASKQAKEPPVDADNKPIAVDQTGWHAQQIELYDYLRRGREVYKDPKVTWTKSWISGERASNLASIGKIEVPPGNPPPADPGSNWLNDGIRSTERGDVFENNQIWILSGKGGWDANHYS